MHLPSFCRLSSRAQCASVAAIAAASLLLAPTMAAAQSFSDIGPDSYLYDAVESLHEKGIISGYSDGTFRARDLVNRAEALKIVVSALKNVHLPPSGKSSYADIAGGAWYQPYVEYAWSTLKIINGPPSYPNFHPGVSVTKAEFLKMFLLSQKIDVKGYLGEIQLPLAYDATDGKAWWYPYIRYAVATSMTEATDQGTLRPDRELNRGSIALFLYRFYEYNDDRQVHELLTQMEAELTRTYKALDTGDLEGANYASARAKLEARGALEAVPDEPLAKGAVKIAEAYRHIVASYKAGATGTYDTAIAEAGLAWKEAEHAREFSGSYDALAGEIQNIAKNAADTSRRLKQK